VCVCVSIAFVNLNSVKTNKRIFNFFHFRVATPFYFFHTERHGNIPTGTPLMWASNAGGVGRNRDSEPISGFTACCQSCDRSGVINTPPPDLGPVSCDTSLVVSGGVSWWLRRRRNVYDKMSQRYAKDNRTAFNCTHAIKDSARRFVLLKLNTDRHEASRGLFATAELLVFGNDHKLELLFRKVVRQRTEGMVGIITWFCWKFTCRSNIEKILKIH